MIRMTTTELARILGCPAPQREVSIDRIVTDSRKVLYGSLFAALPGSQVDGHDYAESAVKLGAVALLVERELPLDVPQLQVDNVLEALGLIAREVRDRIDPLVIGITGSNGKTSVKEMLASILRQEAEVLATMGNYNNELGLPLSLFELTPSHRYAVMEMGAARKGDIEYLCHIARPDVGVITNVGPAHLQGFGDEEGVARAKGEMYASLADDGWAIMNADQPWAALWHSMKTTQKVMTFGAGENADVRVVASGDSYRMVTPAGSFELELALPGEHSRVNAAAAAAAAVALEIPLESIRTGLKQVRPVPGRLNLVRTATGATLIDDTYNANPASLYSALRVLAELQGTGWLVLGDMKELGGNERKMHAEVGEAARLMGISRIFATGELTRHTVDAFGQGGSHYARQSSLIDAVCRELRPGINCLVKGSRSMGMEAVVEAILLSQQLSEAG